MQRWSERRVPQNKASRVLIVTQSQAHQAHSDAGSSALGFDPALLRAIAERVGTPTYVYGANLIRAQYHALQDALRDIPHRICYSVKANGNIGVLRVLKGVGAGADIVSVGELRRALAAGFDAASIVFSGVGKTALELEEAIRVGVGFLNIESPAELDAVIAVAHRLKKRANLGIRVNPDVATETHPYTKTGERTAKFGVPYDEVVSVAQRIAAEPLFTLRGLAMHLGSQITDVEPYHRGTIKLLELVTALRASGITTIEALDVGGGLGVKYHNEKAPSPQAFAEAVAPPIKQAGLALVCEPGRYLVANAGVLVTRVLYRKHAGGKEFVVVDAGMTDFVRPSHYNAHHEIVSLRDGTGGGGRPEELVNVVGPICESGDFLALDRKLPAVEPGEYLAVLGTGAYGFVMSSTYNQRPRPPEVLVEGNRYYIARQRETLDDLLRGEILEPTTWYQA
jgi:diaminopimelate decarboxylase